MRRHFKHRDNLTIILRHHAEAAVGFAAWPGDEAVNHLFLQHEVHIFNRTSIAEKVKHQRGRNIVRQVAEDAQRLAFLFRQRGEIEGHRILLIDRQLRTEERMGLQTRSQIAVQLDHR